MDAYLNGGTDSDRAFMLRGCFAFAVAVLDKRKTADFFFFFKHI